MPTYNKVELDGTTLLDLSQDTVASASHIRQGYTAHLNDGSQVTGTYSGGGGASNIVTGTFTGTTTGAAMDVTIPYTGTGYPIALIIMPTAGTKGGTFGDLVQRYAFAMYAVGKTNTSTSPTYSSNAEPNGTMTAYLYKGTSATAYSGSYNAGTYALRDATASATGADAVKIRSATSMSVYIASTSYGFAANIEYTYRIIYSS